MRLLSLFLVTVAFHSLAQKNVTTIAFGSCSDEDEAIPALTQVLKQDPDLFIYLGDNIYGDTRNMCVLRKKYRKMKKNSYYKALHDSVPIIATWDDHDFGQNDAGRHYPKKRQSKKIFLKFFEEPKNSPRYTHEGIYTSYTYPSEGKTIQVILLDLRTFRDDLLPYQNELAGDSTHRYTLDYSPYQKADSALLGEMQWKWLEEQLKQPADLRIIGSSTQFGTEYNGYEAWANFPHEQERLFALIKTTGAKGVLIISGDLHYAELSKRLNPGSYPIYDLTSSGLTEKWSFSVPNKFRIGQPIMDNNFGMVSVNWKEEDPLIILRIIDATGMIRLQQYIRLSELR